MTLNLYGKNPYTGLLSKFSLQFQQFIKDLGDAKSKSEEDRIVAREASFLKEAIHKAGVSPKQQKEHIVRLIYCDMLGADVTFSHMEAVKFAQQQNLLEKRVAYSAICLFLDEKNSPECMMMNTGTVQRDLKSTNILEVCFGLLAAAKVVTKGVLPGVLPLVKELVKHKREVVRKKAVMTMFKFYEMDLENMNDYMGLFQSVLCDKDPAVMSVSLNAFHKFILADPAPFKILVASFVSILKQIVEKKLPTEFNFKGVPAPWMQIKLLQILALLGSEDSAMSKMMYEVLRQCLEDADTEQGVGFAVAYECMKTIATVYPNRALVEVAAGKAALFLLSDIYNLKYLGINALSDFINVDMSYGTRHQMVIIECLTDHDESIKRKTLELLYRMTNGSNVKFICERLIVYLKSTVDEYVKSDLVLRITTLAEKYAPDNEWFIETMNEVFELGGDLVPVKVAYNMMTIIGEGVGDDEDEYDDTTDELRRYAVMSYIGILDKPVIPDILVQLACWVLGEYFDLIEDYQAEDITAKLYKLLRQRFTDSLTQSWVVSAITKIVCRAEEPTKLIQDIDTSLLNDDAQQRYKEMKATVRICNNLEHVFPYDASCEDVKVDVKLSFLNDFVARAIEKGCDAYSPDTWHTKKSEKANDKEHSGQLRFDKYEEPTYHRVFQRKETESLSPATQRSPREKEKSSPLDANVKKACKPKNTLWTRDGYAGSRSKEGSSNSEVSTPASSETSSVKTEDDIVNVNQLVGENVDESAQSPTKSIKEEIAKQLFTTPSAPDTHRKRKGVSPRRPKPPKSRSPVVDLLNLDIDEEEPAVDIPFVSLLTTCNDSIIDTTLTPDDSDVGSVETTGVEFGITDIGATAGISPPQTNESCTPDNINEMFHMMEINESPQTSTLLINNSLASNMLISPTEQTQIIPFNIMDDVVYEPATSTTVSHQETEMPDHVILDTTTDLPDELKQYKHSPNPIEICSNNHMRISCHYVYQPTKLSLVFFLFNQSPHMLTEIQFVIKLPSNLRSVSTPIDFYGKELESMSSCTHTISVTFGSPALHMMLSGNVKYRDWTNTEKTIFVDNHVLPLSTLIRPSLITVDEFGSRWKNRSLKEKKGKTGVKLNNVKELTVRLDESNFHTVEIIGKEVIFAGNVLNKDEMLLHIKLMQFSCEISCKSTSTLLNDAVMKMLLVDTAR